MPLKIQNKLSFSYVINFFYFAPPATEHHVSILSSKNLITPVDCVRGWKPISLLPLRDKRLSCIKPRISRGYGICEKKDIPSIIGLCWPPLSPQSNAAFWRDEIHRAGEGAAAGSRSRRGLTGIVLSYQKATHGALCFCPQPSPSKSYKATVAFQSCG